MLRLFSAGSRLQGAQALHCREQTPGCSGSSLQCAASVVAVRELIAVAHGLSFSAARGILVPRPGMEPGSPALEGGFLATGKLGLFFLEELPAPVWAHTVTASRKQMHNSAWRRVWSLPNAEATELQTAVLAGPGSGLSTLYFVCRSRTNSIRAGKPLDKKEIYTDKAVQKASGTHLIHPSSAMLKGVPGSTYLS